MLKVAGHALKGDEKAFKFNDEALRNDSNVLNDNGDVLKGRFGYATGYTKRQWKKAKG